MRDNNDVAMDYLLAEYNNIAAAHFKTIDTLSTFFKHYLLIMSIPVTIGIALVKVANVDLSAIGPAVLWLFATVGLAVFWYIANLRMDAILYARTINALRKFFYDKLDVGLATSLLTRVLPQTQFQPAYHEIEYFYPVVVSFALIDGAYVAAASFVSMGLPAAPTNSQLWAIAIPAMLFGLSHLASYSFIAWYRDTRYLRHRWIGLDLDGVVNDHTRHFCDKLLEKRGKRLDPSQITSIPVHEISDLGVSREDEREIFNDPLYWTEMPARDGAAKTLCKLNKALGYRIIAFTHRGWPDLHEHSQADRAAIEKRWTEEYEGYVDASRPRRFGVGLLDGQMRAITKQWLRVNGFPEKMGLVVERGTDTLRPWRAHERNRFRISEKKRIRMFIEDDPEKAFKLAHICDVVLLVDQPYNRESDWPMPRNVVRVESWAELYRVVRALS